MRCSLRASLLSPLAQQVAPFLWQPLFSHLLAASSLPSGVAAGHRKLGKVWAKPRVALCPGVRASPLSGLPWPCEH